MLLDAIFGKRSVESPARPLNSASIGEVLVGGNESTSGVAVTSKTALGYPAFWRGVNVRAGTISRLSLNVLRREGVTKEKDVDHPAHSLLNDQPNPFMSAKSFRCMLESHAILTGGGFASIIRDSFGRPSQLIPLAPEDVIPFREGGKLFYSILVDGSMITELPANILHIKGLSWDGINGIGVIEQLKESIGLGLAAQRFQSVFFKNGASPQTVIELPGSLRNKEAVERFRAMWGKRHRGVDNAHTPALLENGASLKPFSISPADAEMLTTREYEVKQIANIIGIPSHYLGDSTRTSFASLEVENRNFLRDLADPMSNWEDECKIKLLTVAERENRTHTIEFNKEDVERPDLNTTITALVSQTNNGLLTLDEARNKLNMPPLPNGEGSKHRIPLNIGVIGEQEDVPVSQDQEPTNDDTGEPGEVDEGAAARALYAVAFEVGKGVQRVSVEANKRAKTPGKFIEWIDNINDRHIAIVSKNLRAVCNLLAYTFKIDEAEFHSNLVRGIFEVVRSEYLTASECSEEDLPLRVSEAGTSAENKALALIKETIDGAKNTPA